MNNTAKTMAYGMVASATLAGCVAWADPPPECPQQTLVGAVSDNPPLIGTTWTIKRFVTGSSAADRRNHLCVGDTLTILRVIGVDGLPTGEVLIPGADLARRWGLSEGANVPLTRMPNSGRLCTVVNLDHSHGAVRRPDHLYQFQRAIDDEDKIVIKVTHDHVTGSQNCENFSTPDAHNGVLHGEG